MPFGTLTDDRVIRLCVTHAKMNLFFYNGILVNDLIIIIIHIRHTLSNLTILIICTIKFIPNSCNLTIKRDFFCGNISNSTIAAENRKET